MDDIEVMARGLCCPNGCRKEKKCSAMSWAAEAQVALAALEASGRVVVPKEPTEAMVAAAWRYQPNHPNPTEAYRAMIEEASNAGK
jgi:hypothetical protein